MKRSQPLDVTPHLCRLREKNMPWHARARIAAGRFARRFRAAVRRLDTCPVQSQGEHERRRRLALSGDIAKAIAKHYARPVGEVRAILELAASVDLALVVFDRSETENADPFALVAELRTYPEQEPMP